MNRQKKNNPVPQGYSFSEKRLTSAFQNGECVVARLTLKEMIRVLQFTNWWEKYIEKHMFGRGEFIWLKNIVGYTDLIQHETEKALLSEIGQLKDSGELTGIFSTLMDQAFNGL